MILGKTADRALRSPHSAPSATLHRVGSPTIGAGLVQPQYLMHCFKQRSCEHISVTICDSARSQNSDCSASGASACLDIPLRIADHPRRGEVNLMFVRRGEQHAWLWLAATAWRLLLVRTVIDSIDLRAHSP